MSRLNVNAIRTKMASEEFAKLFLSQFYPTHMDLIDDLEFEDVTYPNLLNEQVTINCYNKLEQAVIKIKFDSNNDTILVEPALSRLTRFYMPFVFAEDEF